MSVRPAAGLKAQIADSARVTSLVANGATAVQIVRFVAPVGALDAS